MLCLGGISGLGMAVLTEGSGMPAMGTDLKPRLGYRG